MFKLALLYFELVAIFSRLGRGVLERTRRKTITPSLSQLVSPPTADELLKPVLAYVLPFHRKLVATSPAHLQKRACRRFQNNQTESIFFSVSPFSAGFIDMLWTRLSRDYRVSRALPFSLIHYIIEYLLNSSSSFLHRMFLT
jgi:hypothetical protein